LYIASYLRKSIPEIDIKIIDGSLLDKDKFLKLVRNENPDLMGLSYTTLDADNAEKISWSIKKILPDTLLVAGGSHPTAMPEITLKNSAFDLIVIGEGEETFKEIMYNIENNKINNLNKIKGVAFLKNRKYFFTGIRPPIENLDSLPFPARDMIDLKKYNGYYLQEKTIDTNFLSSRGCPFNCLFCSNPVWKFYKPRIRSPENIVEELSILKDGGVNEIFDYCDEFNLNLNKTIEICNAIKESKLDIRLKTHIRADNVTNKLAESMSKAGYWLVLMGIESSSNHVLKGIRKGITIKQVIQACKKFKKYGIKVAGYFMAFNSWEENKKIKHETIEDVRRTVNFIKNMKKEGLIDFTHFGIATPMPGSTLYKIANNYGLIKSYDYSKYNAQELLIDINGINQEEFKSIRKSIALIQSKEVLFSRNLNPRHTKFLFKLFLKSFV
jgi:radical SAM superfamily enzyme YgiQ (UPF0313 family)